MASVLSVLACACGSDDGTSSETVSTTRTVSTTQTGTSTTTTSTTQGPTATVTSSGTTAGGCPADGVADGNPEVGTHPASIAYFTAVLDAQSTCAATEADVRLALDAIATQLGMPMGARASAIRAELQAVLAAHVEGSVFTHTGVIDCPFDMAGVDAFGMACDPDTTPIQCDGQCEIAPDDSASCLDEGVLFCRGDLADCVGTCVGDCQLDAPAVCNGGHCQGTCGGTCTVQEQGACAGMCDGDCQGTCDFPGGGNCQGTCLGLCRFSSEGPDCGPGVTHVCGGTGISACAGPCSGAPGMGETDNCCRGSIYAHALLTASCDTPGFYVGWQFVNGLDALAAEEFTTMMTALESEFSALEREAQQVDIAELALNDLDLADGFIPECVADDPCAFPEVPVAMQLLADSEQQCLSARAQALEVLAALD